MTFKNKERKQFFLNKPQLGDYIFKIFFKLPQPTFPLAGEKFLSQNLLTIANPS